MLLIPVTRPVLQGGQHFVVNALQTAEKRLSEQRLIVIPLTLIIFSNKEKIGAFHLLQDLPPYSLSLLSLAWSPDGKKLISGGGDGMLYWWEIDSGHRTLTRKAHQGMVYALKVSPDGRILASCGDDSAIHL